MPLVNTPPVSVPGAGIPAIYEGPLSETGNDNFNGPFAFAGSLYWVMIDFGGANNGQVSVYRSSDNGVTWALQNNAGEDATSKQTFAVSRTLVGSVIHVAMIRSAGGVVVQTFDCSTNTWNAVSPSQAMANAIGLGIVVQPDGRRFVFVTASGAANTIRLIVLSAVNVWSGPTTVVTAAALRHSGFIGATLDGTGVCQVFFGTGDTAGGLNGVISQVPVSSVPVVGAITNIATLNPIFEMDTGIGIFGFNLSLGANGTYAIPSSIQFGNGAFGKLPQVVLGDPVGGWVISSPDPGGTTVPAGSSGGVVMALGVGSTIKAFWNVYDGTTGLVDSLWWASWDGVAWSAPVLVYDAAANPPLIADPVGPSQQLSNPVSVAVLPSGAFGLGFALRVTIGIFSPGFPQFFAMFSAGPVPQPKTAGIAFVGVRRMKGTKPQVCPEYPNNPKSFTWILPVSLPLAGGAVITTRQLINDYDFELYQLILLAQQGANPAAAILKPVASLLLYDVNKVAISNLPVLDLFLDGCPNGVYKNGAIVTPLRYCKNSSIQLDVTSQITDPALLPTTLIIHLVGRKLYPC